MIFGLPSVVFSSINGFERTRKQREFPKKNIIINPTLAWGGRLYPDCKDEIARFKSIRLKALSDQV